MSEQREPWGPETRPQMPPMGGATATAPGGETTLERATEGALSGRLWAYLIDLVIIAILWMVLAFAITIVGIVTFGLGWGLYMVLPFIGIIYSALMVGGSGQGTYGMRMMGLKAVEASTGGKVDLVTAAVHSLLFYVAVTTFVLWLADIFIGFARSDRRLGHDLLTGVVLVRR